jgi:predicted permease
MRRGMIRSLLKNWKINSIAVFSLAIAIALSVVALSISNAILLRPPVAHDPERLVTLYTVAGNGAKESFSHPDYTYVRDHSRTLSGVAALNYGYYMYDVSYGNRDELGTLDAVSDNYFEVMGIRPFLGRFFAPGDDQVRAPAAVLTYSCWTRWDSDPGIIGKTVIVNKHPLTIVGVSPKVLIAPVFGFAADVIVNIGGPANIGGDPIEDREARFLLLVGRLNPGATREQARAELRVLWNQLATAYPQAERNRTADLVHATVLPPDQINTARFLVAVLITAALLTLLIACANVANLLLALATQRRQETLIKMALGASRMRLIGEFLKETIVLCASGGVLGYALALAALAWLSRFDVSIPVLGSLRIAADLHPGALVAALTLALIVLASVVSGLAPALYASKPNLASALSGEIAIGGTRRGVIRNAVAVTQVTVCTLVLVGTGLCLRSLHNLRQVDPGFSARRIVMIFPDTGGLAKEQGARLYAELRRRVGQIGGIESVSLVRSLPLGGGGGNDFDHEEVRFTDRPASDQKTFVHSTIVDENYFSTLGIPLLAGRPFRFSDLEKMPEVIVINRFMAEQFWPRQNPIGRTILTAKGNRLLTIVGVAADGKYGDLDEPQLPFMYHALGQRYQSDITLIARTRGDPRLWTEPISRTIRQMGVKLPFPAASMESWMNLTLFYPLLALGCAGGLSALAMLLTTIGLYGTISYSVGERRMELGIRTALGAGPAQLMQLVFRETLIVAGTGVMAGLALGVAAGTILRSQFYGIHRLEWFVLAPVAMAMIAISLAIALAAGWRWAHMSPMDAVRHA